MLFWFWGLEKFQMQYNLSKYVYVYLLENSW